MSEKTGKKPGGVKRADTNNGTCGVPIIRCRLVARNFKVKGDKDLEDLFAATEDTDIKNFLQENG